MHFVRRTSFTLAILAATGAVAAPESPSAKAAGTGDYFGTDVAILDDTLLVGAPSEDLESGVAHVFSRQDGVWTKSLSIPSIFEWSNGATVKLTDRFAIIGSAQGRGEARVFDRVGGNFLERARLTNPENLRDGFGVAIDVSGSRIAVGANGLVDGTRFWNADPYVSVFKQAPNGDWVAEQVIESGSSQFGQEVEFASETELFIAAPAAGNGIVRRYDYVNGAWTLKQTFYPPSGLRNYGNSIATAGGFVFITGEDESGGGTIHVAQKGRNGLYMTTPALSPSISTRITDLDAALVPQLGVVRVLVGAGLEQVDGRAAQGKAYSYRQTSPLQASWIVEGVLTQGSNGRMGDHFGHAVALDSLDNAVGGAPLDDSNFVDQGTASIFSFGGTWSFVTRVSALTP